MDKAAQRSQWLHEVDEGKRIAEILADDTVQSVFARLESQAVSDWRDAEDYHKSLQSDAWQRLRGLDAFKSELESIVNTGRMAAAQLEGAKRGQS